MTVENISPPSIASFLGIESREALIRDRSALEFGTSPSADEYGVLCELLSFSRPRNIFEFGTCAGGSTRVLADNAPDACVFTLDLHAMRNDQTADSEVELQRRGQEHRGVLAIGNQNVVFLRGDSRTFDFSPLPPMDCVFIDGGHDYGTVKSDTENAFRMLNRSNPRAVIAWHDCSNPVTPEVTRLTDELSERVKIYGALGLTLRFYSPILCERESLRTGTALGMLSCHDARDQRDEGLPRSPDAP